METVLLGLWEAWGQDGAGGPGFSERGMEEERGSVGVNCRLGRASS